MRNDGQGRAWTTVAARIATTTSIVVLAACGGKGERVVSSEFGAVPVTIARPSFTLHDTDGRPFPFATKTKGLVTFLEFGYTHCPDVCPVHLANLAAVLGKLAPSERMKTRVVFVSVDPNRDTPAVLRKWLANFDSTFIGLTGTQDDVNNAALAVGFGPALYERYDDTTTLVTHAAPVVVFTADDTAHAMYPFGTRQADWERDMPRLLGLAAAPGASGAVAAPAGAGRAVERAYVVVPAGQGPAAIYLTIRNGEAADTITAIDTPDLGPASMHQSKASSSGSMSMLPVERIPIAAGSVVRFAPGSFHGMVGPLTRVIKRGETLPLVVRFAHGAAISVTAHVITYADVDTATSAR